MKTQLIKLPDYNIIVSDEEIKEGELIIFPNTVNGEIKSFSDAAPSEAKYDYASNGIYNFKLIASEYSEHNLPSIDYNGFEEELGIIDVEREGLKILKEELEKNYVRKYININLFGHSQIERDIVNKIIKKTQELSKNKYTEEDIRKAIDFGQNKLIRAILPEDVDENLEAIGDFIEDFKNPKIFDIEIEGEEFDIYSNKGTSSIPSSFSYFQGKGIKPKITDNKIKITKING